jgi:hypothetical protein
MLWAMMITWLVQGQPRYISQEGRIAFISDVGADMLKPLFIAGCSVTAVGFVLCLVIERYLRHSGRSVLVPSWVVLRPCHTTSILVSEFTVY